MADEYLRKTDTGVIFIRSDKLAKRNDMVPCDKNGRRLYPEGDEPGNSTDMEIMGSKYTVPDALLGVIDKLKDAAEAEDKSAARAKVKEANDQLKISLAENNELRKKVIDLDVNLMDLQANASNLTKENSALRKSFDLATGTIEDKDREIKDLKAQLKSK